MASINLEILKAAHADGLLPKRLSRNQSLYLHPSVLRANQIYWAIAEGEGVNFEQLEKSLGLHPETLKQFCRWMIKQEILYAEEFENRKYVMFTKKRHKVAKLK